MMDGLTGMQINTAHDLLTSFENTLSPVYGFREAKSMARLACCHLLGYTLSTDLYLHLQAPVDQSLVEMGKSWLGELMKGRPIQHLIGEVLFDGMRLKVNGSVLIPRPETEELALIIKQGLGGDFKGSILDIGTGSGCLALACKRYFPLSTVMAMDASPMAAEVARHNAKANHLAIEVHVADMFLPLPISLALKYDAIISNPPYLGRHEAHSLDQNVRDYEPDMALFSPNDDPLSCYKAIVAVCHNHLREGGSIYLEMSEFYSRSTARLFDIAFHRVRIELDLQGRERFLVCEGKRSLLR